MTFFYKSGLDGIVKDQDLDLVNDTIVAVLMKSSYVPDFTSDASLADLSASETNASSYVRKTLTGKSLTVTNGVMVYAATIPSWSPIGGGVNDTIGHLVLAKSTGVDATSPLICCFSELPIFPYVTSGIELSLVTDSNGLFYFGVPS